MKYYAIRNGIKSNLIVTSWPKCKQLVDGYPNASFKSFKSELEAKNWLKNKPKNKPKKKKKPRSQKVKPIYYMVDGVQFADYGRTIGEFYVPFTGDTSIPPWECPELDRELLLNALNYY